MSAPARMGRLRTLCAQVLFYVDPMRACVAFAAQLTFNVIVDSAMLPHVQYA